MKEKAIKANIKRPFLILEISTLRIAVSIGDQKSILIKCHYMFILPGHPPIVSIREAT